MLGEQQHLRREAITTQKNIHGGAPQRKKSRYKRVVQKKGGHLAGGGRALSLIERISLADGGGITLLFPGVQTTRIYTNISCIL